MKKYFVLSAIIAHFICFSQNKTNFTLYGSINVDTGKISLLPIADSTFYPSTTYNNEKIVTISNGLFTITGFCPYPLAYRILVTDTVGTKKYISGLFFIDIGNQNITCNIKKNWQTPIIKNKTTNEYESNFAILLNKLTVIKTAYADSIKAIYQKPLLVQQNKFNRQLDVLLNNEYKKYLELNNSSYVLLWHFVDLLFTTSHSTIQSSLFNKFSTAIKNTPTAIFLTQKNKTIHSVSIGKTLPETVFLNQKFIPKNLISMFKKSKYTLIDFWFSRCNPCVKEFPALDSLFNNYQRKDFNILSVSIDKKDDFTLLQKTIKAHKIPWLQFLDFGGKKANKLQLISYPSNFLVDNKGKILATNIKPSQLKVFLEECIN